MGFISSFDELAEPDRRLGRKVAKYGLASALMEYGPFDEMHFFLPFPNAVRPFVEGYSAWLEKPEIRDRVRVLPIQDLPRAAEAGYEAWHAGAVDNFMPELCHLRNRYAAEPFPVTFTPHSLNYWNSQVRNLYRVLPGPRRYDSIFCTSRAAIEYFEKAHARAAAALSEQGLTAAGYAGRLDPVPLGVRCDDFKGVTRSEARSRLGLDPEATVFLCLGRLSPVDKYDLGPLLGALALLNRTTQAHLVLAGAGWQGYDRLLLETAASLGLGDRTRVFVDFDTSQKADLLAAADVFVSPADNLQETFGLTIIEAMAAGLPVVASDLSGYRDLVVEGETGFLIPTIGPGELGPDDAAWPVSADWVAAYEMSRRTALDFDRLYQALADLAASPDLRRTLGRAGRGRALAEYDWPVVVGRMAELWMELKNEAASRPETDQPPDPLGAGREDLFGHFTTRAAGPDLAVRPGPMFREFREGTWGRKTPLNLAWSDPGPGLEAVSDLVSARGRVSLGEIAAALAGDLSRGQVRDLLLWGLKYGVLAPA